MFLQPVVGSASDRSWTRIGRRKPWLLLGAPIAAIFFVMVPFVRDNFVLIAIAILGTNVGMALFRSPTVAYLGDLFEPRDRSKANGVINLMGGLGGALALFAGGALYKIGVPLPFIFGAAVMLLAVLVVIIFVQEPKPDQTETSDEPGLMENVRHLLQSGERNGLYLLLAIFCWFVGWNAMEAFFTIYARGALGIEVGSGTMMLTAFAATLILFAIPSGLIATRFGRKPTIIVGLCGMGIGLLLGLFVRDPTLMLVLLAFMGMFWALININSLPMVYDFGGAKMIGALTGLYYFSASAAAITGPILGGWMIDLTDQRVIWLFSAVFMGLAILAMTRISYKPEQDLAVEETA